MRIKMSMTIMLLLSVLLVACSNDRAENSVTEEGSTEDIKELVQAYSVGDIEDESASITSTALIVTDSEENEEIYPLPQDEFFVSIAPYIDETHPCTNHSLTGCQGELVEKEFDIFIEDTEGNVVIEDTLKTEENGFIDLWLPRDKTYKIEINHDGKKVESEFSTFEDDGTCITTLQLM